MVDSRLATAARLVVVVEDSRPATAARLVVVAAVEDSRLVVLEVSGLVVVVAGGGGGAAGGGSQVLVMGCHAVSNLVAIFFSKRTCSYSAVLSRWACSCSTFRSTAPPADAPPPDGVYYHRPVVLGRRSRCAASLFFLRPS